MKSEPRDECELCSRRDEGELCSPLAAVELTGGDRVFSSVDVVVSSLWAAGVANTVVSGRLVLEESLSTILLTFSEDKGLNRFSPGFLANWLDVSMLGA